MAREKCNDKGFFDSDEPVVSNDVKDFIETVSKGSLTIPHVCTFNLLRYGLSFIKEARQRSCYQKRLTDILMTLAKCNGLDIDCPNMFHRLDKVLLNGLQNLEKDQQRNGVLLQTSVKKARLAN